MSKRNIYRDVGCSQEDHLPNCSHFGHSGAYLSPHSNECKKISGGGVTGPCICNPKARAKAEAPAPAQPTTVVHAPVPEGNESRYVGVLREQSQAIALSQQAGRAVASPESQESLEITVEKMKRLYDEGAVHAANDWLDKQHDPFEIIAGMRKAGNLPMLLAHYKVDHSSRPAVASPHDIGVELDNAIYELALNLGGTFANGEHYDYETVREATRRLNRPDSTEPAHCCVCDRPKSDCACVENGGTY